MMAKCVSVACPINLTLILIVNFLLNGFVNFVTHVGLTGQCLGVYCQQNYDTKCHGALGNLI